MTRLQAVLELVFAAAIWGFGFVATQWALTSFTTPELLVHRFSIAVVIGLTLSFVLRRRAFQLRDILIAAPAGISLGLTLLLQTIGLETTTATKSGFITTLYVILVPIFLHLFWGIRSTKFVYISCLVAIVGVGLLGNLEYEGFVVGDLWTLGCAVAASLQIIAISRFSSRIDDALAFNNAQSVWCLVTVVPLLLMQDHVALFT
ncbi:MAG: DMT family transporter, partial [Bdellovibrionaceae bacterium]|nr:DMT family transporter [Pseudobdellovibrionaceae bacterium]